MDYHYAFDYEAPDGSVRYDIIYPLRFATKQERDKFVQDGAYRGQALPAYAMQKKAVDYPNIDEYWSVNSQ